MATIIVTGTPATGKTTLARLLSKRLAYTYLDVASVIAKQRIAEGYDRKRKCHVVDTDRLNKALLRRISRTKNVIIDSHLSHFLPPGKVDLCIVATCSLRVLKKRLEERYDDPAKVRENLDAEIFGICLNEAREMGHKVLVARTTRGITDKALSRLISRIRDGTS